MAPVLPSGAVLLTDTVQRWASMRLGVFSMGPDRYTGRDYTGRDARDWTEQAESPQGMLAPRRWEFALRPPLGRSAKGRSVTPA